MNQCVACISMIASNRTFLRSISLSDNAENTDLIESNNRQHWNQSGLVYEHPPNWDTLMVQWNIAWAKFDTNMIRNHTNSHAQNIKAVIKTGCYIGSYF